MITKNSDYLKETARGSGVVFLATALTACAAPPAKIPACSVQSRPFGTLSSGEPVTAYTVDNGRIGVTILNYGGIIQAIHVPDRDGKIRNVVRTFEKLSDYEGNATFSKIIGRFAGRIGNGGFVLDGKRHDLVSRPDGVSVHGGPGGFGSRMWAAATADCGVDLALSSTDGENGFPGNLLVKAEFRIADADLSISYTAATDKPTVVNLTHHAFFNLSGAPTVYDHELEVNANHWLPTDAKRVPTGEIAPVTGVMDLRTKRTLGVVVNSSEAVIKGSNGLDHTFVLNQTHAATLKDPASGRMMEIHTSEPGIVVFSGNGFNGSLRDAEGKWLIKGGGIAFETQHFPNSPNIPAFPSTVVRPESPLHSKTTFRFTTN